MQDLSADKRPQSSMYARVARVICGNFLEMFDFFVYGFYASIIAKVLFPPGDDYFSLMLSWVTFGVGFLMRPLGAVILGAFADKHGRRAGLLLSLALMSAGVVCIGFVPSYAAIGPLAPIIVLVGRLLQGFSAGAESGTVSVYLAEIAPEGRRGLFASLQTWSQQVAVIFASAIGIALKLTLSPDQMTDWGWRVPFVVGSALIPFLLVMRRSIEETEAFKARRRHPDLAEIWRTLWVNWRLVGTAMMMITLTAVMFYLITAYMAGFGSEVLHLSQVDSFPRHHLHRPGQPGLDPHHGQPVGPGRARALADRRRRDHRRGGLSFDGMAGGGALADPDCSSSRCAWAPFMACGKAC